MKQANYIVFLSLLCSLTCSAQIYPTYWFFGDSAGIVFTENGLVVDSASHLESHEGCGVLMDAQGGLMAYASGTTVYDKNHNIMPNGDSIYWNTSAAQTSLFLQLPDHLDKFLMICTGQAWDSTQLFYSLVDFSLNNGLGDVVDSLKSVPLGYTTGELLNYVNSTTHNGYWLITHRVDSTVFRVYKIDSNGVNLNYTEYPYAVNFQLDTAGTEFAGAASMAVSPNEKILACSFGGRYGLYEIDAGSGAIEPYCLFYMEEKLQLNYSLEFSADNSKLYGAYAQNLTLNKLLIQFDLTQLPDTNAFINSRDTVCVNSCDSFNISLKRGPDDKIYLTSYPNNRDYLSVINKPNLSAQNCDYQQNVIPLSPRNSRLGLPFYTYRTNYFRAINVCAGDSVLFTSVVEHPNQVEWNFGDSATGTLNIAFGDSVYHVFSDTGAFTVTTTYRGERFQWVVSIVERPQALAKDTFIRCMGDSISINIEQPFAQLLWFDSSTSTSRTFLDTGRFALTLYNACDTVHQTIVILSGEIEAPFLPSDSIVCRNAMWNLKPLHKYQNASFRWSNGDTSFASSSSNINWDSLGSAMLWLEIQNECGVFRDSILLHSIPDLDLNWFQDTAICGPGNFIVNPSKLIDLEHLLIRLDSINDTVSSLLPITTSGHYMLEVWNECDTLSKSVFIRLQPQFGSSAFLDTTICNQDSFVVDLLWENATYVWSNGSSDNRMSMVNEGVYTVTISSPPCAATLTYDVKTEAELCDKAKCPFEIPNVFSPNSDGINDYLTVTNPCGNVDFTLSIFNRWGQVVFQSNKTLARWDGYVEGSPAAEGTYFLVVELYDQSGLLHIHKSSVLLTR